jgi:hypothetical protein
MPQFSRKTRLSALRNLRCHDSSHSCIVLAHKAIASGHVGLALERACRDLKLLSRLRVAPFPRRPEKGWITPRPSPTLLPQSLLSR